MFAWLTDFDRILVTGPHRAGTRICTQMIAHDTGHEYVDEAALESDSLSLLADKFKTQARFVAQCPGLCRFVHLFGRHPQTAIIMMRRGIDDIIASQKRIGWSNEWLELGKYGVTNGPIAVVKYEFWDAQQKQLIDNPIEIEYESLSDHPFWLPAQQRRGFWATQTASSHKMLFSRNRQVFSSEQDGEWILVIARGTPKKLNGMGQFIWSLLDNSTMTYAEIRTAIKNEYDVDDHTLEQDLIAFLNDMVRHGLIKFSNVRLEKTGNI